MNPFSIYKSIQDSLIHFEPKKKITLHETLVRKWAWLLLVLLLLNAAVFSFSFFMIYKINQDTLFSAPDLADKNTFAVEKEKLEEVANHINSKRERYENILSGSHSVGDPSL